MLVLHFEALVILAALSSIEFYKTPIPSRSLAAPSILMRTQPNGRCFWASLFLACGATKQEKSMWLSRARSQVGFPLHPPEAKTEDTRVKEWALGLNGGNIPIQTRQRIESSITAEAEDLDPKHMLRIVVLRFEI